MRTRVTALSVDGRRRRARLVRHAGANSGRGGAAAEPYTVPRTSWGDPDLQGVWDYRTITPMERRPELGDREFYTDEEVAQLEGRAARRMEQPPDENTPANLVHAEYLTDPGRYVDESRRTSLIVEPPNGRMPPLTAAAQARQDRRARRAPRPARPGGRADSYTDRTLLERCITRGSAGAPLPTLYNNNIRIAQAPGYVAIVHEMVHETRLVPLDGSAVRQRAQLHRRIARPLGRRHARRRNPQLQRQGAVPRRRRQPARHRALHAHRPRQDRLQGHVRGRHAVDAAVDRGVLDAHRRRRALRVRVPRRQLRACATSSRTRATRSAKPRERAR